MADAAISGDIAFRDDNVTGVPSSGRFQPDKALLRRWARWVEQNTGALVSRKTQAALDLVEPADGTFPRGEVTDDFDVAKNGWYDWSGTLWERTRGFSDTAARLVSIGGTANGITASTEPGVDPALAVMLFLTPEAAPTGATTLSVNGETPRALLTFEGNPIENGFVGIEHTLPVYDLGTEYRLMFDHRFLTLSTQTLAARDKAEQWAEEAEDVPVESGQFSAKHHAIKSADSAAESLASAADAETARAATDVLRDDAFAIRESVITVAEASGDVLFFDTNADLQAGLAAAPNLQVARVFVDETEDDHQTWWRKVGGVWSQRPDPNIIVQDYVGATPTDSRALFNRLLRPTDLGAVGDGVTDDIVALELFVEICCDEGRIGDFGPFSYAISRTLYIPATGGFRGSEKTEFIARSDFVQDFVDPLTAPQGGVGTMTGKAPMIFYDGRTNAVGADPTRIPIFDNVAFDGAGYAPHAFLACGVLPLTSSNLRAQNTTKARFVVAGPQNFEISRWKSRAGTVYSSEAAFLIINSTKNGNFNMCNMTGAAATGSTVKFDIDTSYPGPGGEAIGDAVAPTLVKFRGGVWERIGSAPTPLYVVDVVHGNNLEFDGVNTSGNPTVAAYRFSSNAPYCKIGSGRIFGDSGTTPAIINAAVGLTVNGVSMLLWNGSSIFENNSNGTINYVAGQVSGSAPLVGGSAANANFRHDGGGRQSGNAAARAGERQAGVQAFRWFDTDRGIPTWTDTGVIKGADGLEAPADAFNGWPVLTEAAVTTNKLDPAKRHKIVFLPGTATTISDIQTQPGRTLVIIFDNELATLEASSKLWLRGGLNWLPARKAMIVLECVPAASLASGATTYAWLERGRSEGEADAHQLLTEAAVTSNVLAIGRHNKIILRTSVATTINDFGNLAGAKKEIIFDSANTTLSNGTKLKLQASANWNPALYSKSTFECIPGGTLSGVGAYIWIESGRQAR